MVLFNVQQKYHNNVYPRSPFAPEFGSSIHVVYPLPIHQIDLIEI